LKVSLCRIVERGKGFDELELSSVSSLPFLPSFLTSSPHYNTIFEHTLLAIGATEEGLWKLQDFRLAEKTEDERWQEHDLLREYWQTKLSDQERRDWHRKAGEWLRQKAKNLRTAQSKRHPEAWSLEVQKTWVNYLRRAFWHFVAAREAQPRQWWKRLWQRLFANAGETQLALQTASPITRFLRRWGEWDELLRLCQKSLQLAKESDDEKAIAKWKYRLAICLYDRGDYEEAERLYRESLEIISGRSRYLRGLKAAIFNELGLLAHKRGDYKEAEQLFQQSLNIRKQIDERRRIAWTLHALGELERERGNNDKAERLFQQSLELKGATDQIGKAWTLHALGELERERGNNDKAERLFQQSLEIWEQLKYPKGKAATLHALGRLRWKQGRKAEAEELLMQALDIFERIGHRRAKEVRKDLERLQSESA
jgi:tetratricopeptide (TPR) repeat protein